jgi:hypothetical protein
MSIDLLVDQLKKAGWSDFGSGQFLGVAFDTIGKAKVARNSWFVLVESIPVLDAAGLDTWSDHYARFRKKSRSGMFTSGKYFVLILLADTLSADAAERLSDGLTPGLLENPEPILNGGGYGVVVLRDRLQLLMPQEIILWDMVRATEFAQRSNQAVVDYVKEMLPDGGGPEGKPLPAAGAAVKQQHFD